MGAKFSTYKSGVPFSFQVNELTLLPKVLQHTKTIYTPSFLSYWRWQ